LALRQRWSARLLKILGIRLSADAPFIGPGSLIVANHVSWLDIFVINAAFPTTFVSKAEVRGWPLAGWLAAKHETVFLRRGSRGHARIVNGEITALLTRAGTWRCFPKARPPTAAMYWAFTGPCCRPPSRPGAPLQPIAIAYRLPDGQLHPGAGLRWRSEPAGQPARHRGGTPDHCPPAGRRPPSVTDTPDRKALAHLARDAIVAGIAD
jgi:1-acyl-sn-glycerol-3-phosphate acyltransferase